MSIGCETSQHQVFIASKCVDEQVGDAVIVVFACWLHVGVVEVHAQVEHVLQAFNAVRLTGRTRHGLGRSRLELDAVQRNPWLTYHLCLTGERGFGGQRPGLVLGGDGVRVPAVWEVAGLVIRQGIRRNDAGSPVNRDHHLGAERFVDQGVRAEVVTIGDHDRIRRSGLGPGLRCSRFGERLGYHAVVARPTRNDPEQQRYRSEQLDWPGGSGHEMTHVDPSLAGGLSAMASPSPSTAKAV